MEAIFKAVKTLNETTFKDYKFISCSVGANSTDRRNLSRVKKVLDLLDELNRWVIKDETLFYLCSVLIKNQMGKDYEIKAVNNTYSIKRLKK